MRTVSLLPSTTETLFVIGAGDDVVGMTFECDFPPEARSRQIVSTSELPPGLSRTQIDAEVTTRVAASEDLYRFETLAAIAHPGVLPLPSGRAVRVASR